MEDCRNLCVCPRPACRHTSFDSSTSPAISALKPWHLFEVPRFIMLGSESSGKSALLNRMQLLPQKRSQFWPPNFWGCRGQWPLPWHCAKETLVEFEISKVMEQEEEGRAADAVSLTWKIIVRVCSNRQSWGPDEVKASTQKLAKYIRMLKAKLSTWFNKGRPHVTS